MFVFYNHVTKIFIFVFYNHAVNTVGVATCGYLNLNFLI